MNGTSDFPAKGTIKRKRILVNKYYQLKASFGMAGFFTAAIGMLFVVTFSVLFWNNGSLRQAMTTQADLQKVQEEILRSIEMLSRYGYRRTLVFEAQRAMGDLQRNTEALKESNELLRKIIRINTYLVWIQALLGAAFICAVFMVVLHRTHKVAGPMMLLKRYMQQIKDGEIPVIRSLREGDEFKDVFDAFVDMVASLHLKRRKAFRKKSAIGEKSEVENVTGAQLSDIPEDRR